MAVERLQRKYAKAASKREEGILEGLESYYSDEYSLGYLAEQLRMPLRALMEFMEKHQLPYYSDAEDRKKGLKKVGMIRSTL